MVVFSMNTPQYFLIIRCDRAGFNRKLPYTWVPSRYEIYNAIRAIREQGRQAGVLKLIKIEHVILQKVEIEETNCNCVDLDRVNGTLLYKSSIETPL